MEQLDPQVRRIRGQFAGLRTELLGLLTAGYLLFIPTIGIYRFWLVTQKRRFYWSNTFIGGDPLEYTGNARELLFGFLLALVIFIPIYLVLIYLGTQNPQAAGIGTIIVAVLLFFLAGFALFRSRRYRLTRTLWRGIRLHQTGSAWKYAFMRFGWYILLAITLGLVYPFMSASLFRYRFNNTWFGDKKFSFSGSWAQIAGPYYLFWILGAICIALMAEQVFSNRGGGPGSIIWLSILLTIVVLIAIPVIVARERTRFMSRLTIGPARLSVHIRARSLIGMYLAYVGMLIVAFTLVSIVFGMVVGGAAATFGTGETGFDAEELLAQFQPYLVVLGIFAYLGIMAVMAIVAELFISFTFWRMVVRSATIDNAEFLDATRALGEESPSFGEGLADALNVGGY
jgi:uncharacterized membrane protein YjgN (DUF898 family)